MKRKLQIFISSTYIDLQEERQAAVGAILKAGHIPAGMELFTSGDESQMETIKRWIDESDVYMLILGGRYGSVQSSTSLSYVELEYDYAISKGMPIFAVVIKDAALDKKVKKLGKKVIEQERPKELEAFRTKVLGKICTFYDDPKDIKLSVHETISDYTARYEFKGWISGAEIPDIKSIIEDNKRLKAEIETLKTENSVMSSEIESLKRAKGETNEELKTILSELTIETSAFNDKKDEPPKKWPVLSLMYWARDKLAVGIINDYSLDPNGNLLYYNICPKLQMYDLVVNEKVTGTKARRFSLSKKGIEFMKFIEKSKMFERKQK